MIPYLRNDSWRNPRICFIASEVLAASILGGAAVAGSGISAATAGKTNARGSRLAHRQHEWAVQDAKMQREWALEDWNRNAEYLSPAAVAQRYKDAGFSPMAALDNGMATEAPQTAAPPDVALPSAPHFINPLGDMPQIINATSDSLRSILSAKKLQHELNNMDADTDKKIAETDFIWSKKKPKMLCVMEKCNILVFKLKLVSHKKG